MATLHEGISENPLPGGNYPRKSGISNPGTPIGLGGPVRQSVEAHIAEMSQHVSEAGYALTEARNVFEQAQMRLNSCEQNFRQITEALWEQIEVHKAGSPSTEAAY